MTPKIPTEDLLADLRRVADDLGHPPTTTEYDEHGEYGLRTVSQRWDKSWSEILIEADLDFDPDPGPGAGIAVGCPNCGHIRRYDGDRDRFKCRECHTTVPVWRGLIEANADNELLQALAEGPKSGDELPRVPNHDEKVLVDQLKVPPRPSVNKRRGNADPIYYLYGDDRAAVRRFIEVNPEYVESVLADQSNPLRRNWDDMLYELLVGQWRWDPPQTDEGS